MSIHHLLLLALQVRCSLSKRDHNTGLLVELKTGFKEGRDISEHLNQWDQSWAVIGDMAQFCLKRI